MKPKKLIIVISLLLCAVGMNAQSDFFDKMAGSRNVNSVYISKAMLSMAPNIHLGGANIKDIANKLEQLDIYTSESKESSAMMKKDIEVLARNKTYELLMNLKDGMQTITFYALKNKDKFRELIMVTKETDQCVIIRMVGDFTMADIQKVTSKR